MIRFLGYDVQQLARRFYRSSVDGLLNDSINYSFVQLLLALKLHAVTASRALHTALPPHVHGDARFTFRGNNADTVGRIILLAATMIYRSVIYIRALAFAVQSSVPVYRAPTKNRSTPTRGLSFYVQENYKSRRGYVAVRVDHALSQT